MFHRLSYLMALPLLAHATIDLQDDNRMIQKPGILRYPIRVTDGAPIRNLHKRLDSADLTSQMSGNFYSIDVKLGSPGQTVSVNLDTGSSELWVNPVCSKSSNPTFCEKLGHFNSNASSTFNATGKTGGVSYGTGSALFNYALDYVRIGDARLSHQQFGVANDSEASQSGIMGVAPWLTGWNSPYPSVIDSLAKQGFTNSRAFSLDLRSIGSPRGSILFGGVDTKKFAGRLEKRAIIPAEASPDNTTRFWVYLDGLSVSNTDNGGNNSVTVFDKVNYQPVLLDSGSTLSSLPTAMFNTLLKGFPSAQQRGPNFWSIDCPAADSNATVNFKFGARVIRVRLADFVWQPSEGACILGVTPDDQMPVLGDPFLRAAYVVYDWDNRNIHLAASQDCGSNLVPIGRGANAVPSVIGDCRESIATRATTTTSPAPTSGSHNTSVHTRPQRACSSAPA